MWNQRSQRFILSPFPIPSRQYATPHHHHHLLLPFLPRGIPHPTTAAHLLQPIYTFNLPNSHNPRICYSRPPHPQPLLNSHPLHRLPHIPRPFTLHARRLAASTMGHTVRPLRRPHRLDGLLRLLPLQSLSTYNPGDLHCYDFPQHTLRLQRYAITALASSCFSAAER